MLACFNKCTRGFQSVSDEIPRIIQLLKVVKEKGNERDV
jgi:hypothetical protein